jgi:hypothetical protein
MSRNVTVDVLHAHIATQLAGRFADVSEADAVAAELSQSIIKDIMPHLRVHRTVDGYSRYSNRRTAESREKDNIARRNRKLRKKAQEAAAAAEAAAALATDVDRCMLGVCVCGGGVCELF